LKISGSGRLSEGKIDDDLRTSGSTKLSGNFECNNFHSSICVHQDQLNYQEILNVITFIHRDLFGEREI
jgi:hypothetical protein